MPIEAVRGSGEPRRDGGIGDLSRDCGIRSHSDRHAPGFIFKPWKECKATKDGPSILEYVNETADDHGIRRDIRFGYRVRRAHWSLDDATWTVEAEHVGRILRFACNMLLTCHGWRAQHSGELKT